MIYKLNLKILVIVLVFISCLNKTKTNQNISNPTSRIITEEKLLEIYNEVKTPFKYGIVFNPHYSLT